VRDKSEDAATAGTGGVTSVVGVRAEGGEPPDEIRVVFASARGAAERSPGPSGGDAQSPDSSPWSGSPLSPAAPGPESDRWWERQLLLGGLALVAVALATALAWQVRPRTTAPAHADGPRPGAAPDVAPTLPSAPGPGSGGLSEGRSKKVPGAGAAASPHTTAPAVQVGRRPATTLRGRARPVGDAVHRSVGHTGGRYAHPAGRRPGPDVTDLQQLLFGQGLTYVSATGVYDDATVRGVEQVQSDRSLTCDPPGVYGPCTPVRSSRAADARS
jgi:hypothetical protein